MVSQAVLPELPTRQYLNLQVTMPQQNRRIQLFYVRLPEKWGNHAAELVFPFRTAKVRSSLVRAICHSSGFTARSTGVEGVSRPRHTLSRTRGFSIHER